MEVALNLAKWALARPVIWVVARPCSWVGFRPLMDVALSEARLEIGREPCRERVKMSVGAVSLKKKSVVVRPRSWDAVRTPIWAGFRVRTWEAVRAERMEGWRE